MNDFNVILDFCIFGSGIYLLYAAFSMKKKQTVPSLLLSKGIIVKKTADITGFVQNVFVKTIVTGAIGLIAGGVGLYNDFCKNLGNVPFVVMMVYVAALMAYGYLTMKAQKKYLQM